MARPKVKTSKILEYVVENNIDLSKFAKKHKINPTTLRLVLQGHYRPSKELAKQIVDAFDGRFSMDMVYEAYMRNCKSERTVKTKIPSRAFEMLEMFAHENELKMQDVVYHAVMSTFFKKNGSYDTSLVSKKSISTNAK